MEKFIKTPLKFEVSYIPCDRNAELPKSHIEIKINNSLFAYKQSLYDTDMSIDKLLEIIKDALTYDLKL